MKFFQKFQTIQTSPGNKSFADELSKIWCIDVQKSCSRKLFFIIFFFFDQSISSVAPRLQTHWWINFKKNAHQFYHSDLCRVVVLFFQSIYSRIQLLKEYFFSTQLKKMNWEFKKCPLQFTIFFHCIVVVLKIWNDNYYFLFKIFIHI